MDLAIGLLATAVVTAAGHTGASFFDTYHDLVIAVTVALISPLILALIVAWTARRKDARDEATRHADKLEDWARQDKVAELAATAASKLAEAQEAAAGHAREAARLLLEAQAETPRRTEEVARLAAHTAEHKTAALGRIEQVGQVTHALVNSDMTEALSLIHI